MAKKAKKKAKGNKRLTAELLENRAGHARERHDGRGCL